MTIDAYLTQIGVDLTEADVLYDDERLEDGSRKNRMARRGDDDGDQPPYT